MITFPIAKINLGLNIIGRRDDGYHNLETVFYPIPLNDVIEINLMDKNFPSNSSCDLKITNMNIEGDESKNLVVKAYNEVAKHYALPKIHTHLYKGIPTQAGMGGGSSDCAYMIKLLNDSFQLGMTTGDMIMMASALGADCPFFILSSPAFGEGIGEILTPIKLSLKGWHLILVKPDIPISTKDAFSMITPAKPAKSCKDIVMQPVETWKDELHNDFEKSVFNLHPEIADIKNSLYELGASYAAMSGSGSTVFGLFERSVDIDGMFKNMFTYSIKL